MQIKKSQVARASSIVSSTSSDDSAKNPTGTSRELEVEITMDFGELRVLSSTLSEDIPDTPSSSKDSTLVPSLPFSIHNVAPSYGNPLPPEEASKVVPPGNDGLIRYAIVIPDNFCPNGKLMVGLNKRDFDTKRGTIKTKRPSLPLTITELLSSLTKVDSEEEECPRYVFSGCLNGWPSLCHFELVKLEKKRCLGSLQPPEYFMSTIGQTWSSIWRAEKEGKEGTPPDIKDKSIIYRAKLRSPDWTSSGWSPTSPGFIFWFEMQHPRVPRIVYGADAVNEVGFDICKTVHMISHRYATNRETPIDKLTYHSVVFIEWENSQFCTVIEGAFLNGIGGYKGKSNWYEDKDEEVTALYKALPPELVSPWLTTAAELRCYDVKAKNLDEMKKFIEKHSGPTKRFIDPQFTFSHPARLSYRSRSNIAQYLVNYISRNCSYSEITRNCQTFAADLCSFLAGKKDVVPYHPINRIEYYNRAHLFLYDSNMFTAKKNESLKGRIAR